MRFISLSVYVCVYMMEELIKRELVCSTVKAVGLSGGGCISEGQSYSTESGTVFAKINHKSQARFMFDGEKASLEAILSTSTVHAPKPVKVVDLDTGGAVFIMEHIDMRCLSGYSAQLGQQLADLHLHNNLQKEKQKKEEQTVGKGSRQAEVPVIDKFGFHVQTCCGFIPQVNDWQDDWVSFYAQQRLQHQLLLVEQTYRDREARELWAHLQLKIPELFAGVDVKPALLHGDLWSGNVGECSDGPLIFDPASFYGHAEFELGIAGMFGGFGKGFYQAYHQKIPKTPGFDRRHQLYQLFHYLNHWNHFGAGYRGSALSIMKELSK